MKPGMYGRCFGILTTMVKIECCTWVWSSDEYWGALGALIYLSFIDQLFLCFSRRLSQLPSAAQPPSTDKV